MKKLQRVLTILLVSVLLIGCIGNPYKAGIKSLENGEYSKAAEEFQDAIEKEKNLADSYRGLGIALWEEKDYKGAKEALQNALEEGTEPTATIYSLIANCSMELEEYQDAVQFYVLTLSEEDISDELKQETAYNLVAAYEYSGEIELAKEKLSEYIADYPNDESAVREAEFLETR